MATKIMVMPNAAPMITRITRSLPPVLSLSSAGRLRMASTNATSTMVSTSI
ncbi:hypothetical protein D3C85_1834760 [compost metagenome]